MADISKQLEDLLLLLRSRHAKEENLKIDSISTSPQLSESLDFNRPDPKPIYEIKSDIEIPKASSLSNRTIKRHQRISFEEIDKRRFNGLCVFCEEPETPNHYLQHKNSGILMIDSEDHLSNSMVKEIGIEISSDRWLSSSIDCELGTGEIDNDEDRVLSDSDLVVNDIEKEQAKNRSTNSVLQPSLVPQMCSLLKEQVHEAREENSRFENHKNWVQHVLLEEDSTIHFHEPVFKSENLRKMDVNPVNTEAVVGVVERIQQVTSVTKKFSTRQLFDKKFKDKERLKWKKRRKSLKSWRFKFKSRDLRGYNLSRVKLLLNNSLVITWFWRWFMMVNGSEQCHMVEHANMDAERHCYQRSQYIRNRWSEQQVEKLRIFIDVVGEVLFHHSHGLSNRLHRKDLQDLQQFITLGEVKFQIKHKWKFKGKDREVREELSYLTSREIQEDSSHYFLLIAVANWSPHMNFWSTSYHVWHRWKARYCFVGIISTMWAWLFGEGGFDIVKRRIKNMTRGGWRLEVWSNGWDHLELKTVKKAF